MNASLNKKLGSVKWGEFKLGELFDVLSYKKRFDANKVSLVKNGGHPYIVRQSTDNGKKDMSNSVRKMLSFSWLQCEKHFLLLLGEVRDLMLKH